MGDAAARSAIRRVDRAYPSSALVAAPGSVQICGRRQGRRAAAVETNAMVRRSSPAETAVDAAGIAGAAAFPAVLSGPDLDSRGPARPVTPGQPVPARGRPRCRVPTRPRAERPPAAAPRRRRGRARRPRRGRPVPGTVRPRAAAPVGPGRRRRRWRRCRRPRACTSTAPGTTSSTSPPPGSAALERAGPGRSRGRRMAGRDDGSPWTALAGQQRRAALRRGSSSCRGRSRPGSRMTGHHETHRLRPHRPGGVLHARPGARRSLVQPGSTAAARAIPDRHRAHGRRRRGHRLARRGAGARSAGASGSAAAHAQQGTGAAPLPCGPDRTHAATARADLGCNVRMLPADAVRHHRPAVRAPRCIGPTSAPQAAVAAPPDREMPTWCRCLVAEHCWDPVGRAIVDYAYRFERLRAPRPRGG
jgi:hypothetical protein